MAGGRLEVYWSPNSPDKFLTWGSDFSLYQVKNTSVRDDLASTHSNIFFAQVFSNIYILVYLFQAFKYQITVGHT